MDNRATVLRYVDELNSQNLAILDELVDAANGSVGERLILPDQ